MTKSNKVKNVKTYFYLIAVKGPLKCYKCGDEMSAPQYKRGLSVCNTTNEREVECGDKNFCIIFKTEGKRKRN